MIEWAVEAAVFLLHCPVHSVALLSLPYSQSRLWTHVGLCSRLLPTPPGSELNKKVVSTWAETWTCIKHKEKAGKTTQTFESCNNLNGKDMNWRLNNQEHISSLQRMLRHTGFFWSYSVFVTKHLIREKYSCNLYAEINPVLNINLVLDGTH